MGRTLDAGVLTGIGLVVALLVINGGLSYHNIRQLDEDAAWVAHTHKVLDVTGDVLRTAMDAETAQQGFVITGQDAFLQSYDAALSHQDENRAHLKRLTADNPRQQARIQRLQDLFARRWVFLQEGIDLRRKNEQAAKTFIAAGKGQAQIAAIRELVGEMEREEQHLLQDRERRSNRAYTVAVTTGLLTTVLGLALGGALLGLLDRSLRSGQKAAALVHEQRELFRTTLASVGDGVITTDTKGTVTFLNSIAQFLTGWPSEQAVGLPLRAVFRIVNEKTREPVVDPASRALREGTVVGLANHTILIARDGAVRPIDDSAAPIRNEAGEVAGVVLVFRDVTDRQRAEHMAQFLAEASASLAALVDYESTLQKVAGLAVPYFADWCAVDMAEGDGSLRRVAVAHVDPSKVQLAHELYRRYPPDPSAPQGVWHVLRTGQPEIISEITDALLVKSARDEDLLRILRELGLRSYIGVPIQVRGRTLGVLTFVAAESSRRYGPADLAVAQDLGQRVAIALDNARLYSELKEADQRKDEFLAMLAHELRNPLAPIRNAVQILRVRGEDAVTADQAKDMIERQIQHMARLVDDLLDVSRIMQGKIELRAKPVDVVTVVARAVETAQPAIDAQGHQLTVSLPAEPVLVEGDPVRLAQVVSNLLTNSAKYMEAGGRIWLSATRQDTEVVLRVQDAGIGIAADFLPRIFDLFVQAEHGVGRSQGGLGIGLSLVRRLVEMHGGSITAHSEGPGKGSEFIVRLPALPPHPTLSPRREREKQLSPLPSGGEGRVRGESQAAVPPRSEAGDVAVTPQGTRRRILVVDDNVDATESLALLLRLAGQDVRVAYDGPSALETAQAYQPEVVFLDIGMPGMDGYEVARRLRVQASRGDVQLVALTGYGQEEDRRLSREAGFDHHLVKPTDPQELTRLLASLPARPAG